MARLRSKSVDLRRVAVALAVCVVTLAASVPILDLTPADLGRRLLWPLAQLMGTIALGLMVGQVIEATGWTRGLSILARPLFRFGRLGDRCGAAFTAAFVSGVAANAMLQGFYAEGKISRAQLYLTNFVNQLPAFFLHLPTTFFTVVSLTGRAGALYYALTLSAAMGRTFLLLLYGRWRLPPETAPADSAAPATTRQGAGWIAIWHALRDRLPAALTRIGVYVVPIYTAVFVLNRMGVFSRLRDWIAAHVVTAVVPIESLSLVVLSFTAEFTTGFATAGALQDAGMLDVKQTVLALLAGNVLAFPLRALRHQLPHYMGIYAPRMGVQILVLGQVLRVASLAAAGVVFYWIY
jgi:hypothetical protein